MTPREMRQAIEDVADAAPSNVNASLLAMIIANLVNMYDMVEEWPDIKDQVADVLSVAGKMADRTTKMEEEIITIATKDTKIFLERIMKNGERP
mgnify:CR=1 FL=1